MRRVAVLAFAAFGLAACGGGHAARAASIEIGTAGGNVIPMRAVVSADGELRGAVLSGDMNHGPPRHLSSSTVLALDREIRAALAAGLASRECRGTLPDIASEYIRFEGRTVRVHGSCEPRFTRLWNNLVDRLG